MRKDLSQIAPSLSVRVKEIILGSLLGDGSLKINEGYNNARFSFRHSVKNKEYFFWKVKELKEISSENCWWQQNDGKLRYQSLALEGLTELYNLTHKRNKLIIRRKWLNLMTALSLAVWWLDDGSLIANSRKGVFCTDSFDLRSQKILARYLFKVWKVRVKIGGVLKRGVKRYRLFIRSTEMLKQFLRIILPHVPVPEMLSKVILLYKDPQLQQRWISEVVQTTNFPVEIVEKYLEEKKTKWASFR